MEVAASQYTFTSRITAGFYILLFSLLIFVAPTYLFATRITQTRRSQRGMDTMTFASILTFISAALSLLQTGLLYLSAYYPRLRAYLNPLAFFGIAAGVLATTGLILIFTLKVDSCPAGKNPNRIGGAVSFVSILALGLVLGIIQNLAPVFTEILRAIGAQSYAEPLNLALWSVFASALASVYGYNTLLKCN